MSEQLYYTCLQKVKLCVFYVLFLIQKSCTCILIVPIDYRRNQRNEMNNIYYTSESTS